MMERIPCGWSSATSMSLQFWVRSSQTGTYCGNLQNGGGVRCYIFNYVINAANTWEFKTISIPGDTLGTWSSLYGSLGFNVSFDFGAGSNFEGMVNTWNSYDSFRTTGAVRLINTLNATWDLTGVQLAIVSTATGFE